MSSRLRTNLVCAFVAFLALLAASEACRRDAPEPVARPAPAPGASTETVARPPTLAPEAASSSDCASVTQQLQAARASLPSACTTDRDCVCYPGGTELTQCGGVADRAAAARFSALTEQYTAGHCGGTVMCAARMCEPACVAGRCVERPSVH